MARRFRSPKSAGIGGKIVRARACVDFLIEQALFSENKSVALRNWSLQFKVSIARLSLYPLAPGFDKRDGGLNG
jgi:hypothetical protein